MKNLLIIYHSQSGNAEQMAQAVLLGCQLESDIACRLVRAFDAHLDDLLWADGLLFGTPENFGTMSGALKDFFDRTYYPARSISSTCPMRRLLARITMAPVQSAILTALVRAIPCVKLPNP